MANYYESARSNYFKVKDLEAFKEDLDKFDGIQIVDGDSADPNRAGRVCLLATDESFPSECYDDNGDEIPDMTLDKVIAKHLTEDSVFIAMGAGAEKLRYICGWAYAIDCTGEMVHINLDNIYELAKAKFEGKEVTGAQY